MDRVDDLDTVSALALRSVLLALVVLSVLAISSRAEAQLGREGRGGSGGGSVAQRPSPEEDAWRVGKFGLSAPDVLEAIASGEGRQALDAYEKVAREAETQGRIDIAVRALSAAALTALRLGTLSKAVALSKRVIELTPHAPDTPVVARATLSTYVSLGQAYRGIGDLPQARRTFEDGLAYGRAAAGRHERALGVSMASLLRAISQLEASQGDRQAAIAHNREAARILQSIDLRNVTEPFRALVRAYAAGTNLQGARLALGVGRLDDADARLAQAARYARMAGLSDVEAEVSVVAAQVALARNDPQEALRLLGQALAPAERAGRTQILVEHDRLAAIANERIGKLDDALAAAQSAIIRVESVRGELQDPAQRASFLEERQGIYQFAVRLALRAGKPDDAFAIAERSRSRAFLDLLGSQTVLSKGRTRALVEEESRLRTRLHEAATLAQESDDAGASRPARTRVEAAEREYQAFLERVRQENGEQASLMSVEPVVLAEIQALLPEGTTLLEYLVGAGEVVVWIVDRRSVQVRRSVVPRAALVTDVREFRAAIATQAPLAEIETRAQALYQKLVAPALDAIRGTRLLIVPHDVLHYLPFGALRLPDGRWLVDVYALGTAPSASVLKFLADKGAKANDRILAVGNPDLGPALALRYAEREVRAISDRFPSRSTVLTRADATEHRVKQLGLQAGLLHFAVHGELNEQDPMASALLLAPGSGDDGRLEVRELFGLELNARLVVLSACETGLGKLSRGDELVGLQRAFLYAGTPAVVTTLWKVDDRASFLLMRAFYEHLDAKGPTEALRTAQRGLFASFPHPFAWAAFALTGMPR